MSKHIRIILLLVTAVVLLLSTRTIRIRIAEQPVRAYLQRQTGLPVSFSSITYQFPVRFSIHEPVLGSALSCRTITLTLNPVSQLFPRFIPSYLLTKIACNEPRISFTPEVAHLLAKLSGDPLSAKPRVVVSWENAQLKKDTLTIASPSGFVRLGSHMTGHVVIKGLGQNIDAGFSASPAEKGATAIKANISLAGEVFSGSVALNGKYHAGGSVQTALAISSLSAGAWSIKNGVGAASISGGAVSFCLNAPGVLLSLRDNGSKGQLSARFNVFSLSKTASGMIFIEAARNGAGITGNIRTRNARFPYVYAGDSEIYFKRDSSGVITAEGALSPASYAMKAVYSPLTGIRADITDHKRGRGRLSGTLFPLELCVDIDDWQLAGNPFTASQYPGLSGNMRLQGRTTPTKTSMTVTADQWHLPGGRPQSFTAQARSYNNNWYYTVETARKDVRVQGAFLANGWMNLKGSFNGFLLSDALPWFHSSLPVEGSILGTVEYSSRGFGATALIIDNMRWGTILHGTAIVDTRWNPGRCEIRDISLKNSSGSLVLAGQIPFSSEDHSASLHASFQHFHFAHARIDGGMNLSGDIDGSLDSFTGLIAGDTIRVNGHAFHAVRIPLRIGRSRIEITDAAVDSVLTATLFFDRIQRRLGGTMRFAGLPADIVLPETGGHVTGLLKMEGPALQPRITFSGSIPDGVYRSIPFKADWSLKYLNKTVLTDGLKCVSGAGQAIVSGKLWPKPYAAIRLWSMPLNAIAAAAGARGTLKNMPGLISGAATVTSKGVFVDDAVIKVTDSEIRIGKESAVRFDTRSFDIGTELRNVHAGGVDIFGKLLLKGTWEAGKGLNGVSVTLTGRNVWLNQLMVHQLIVPMKVRNAVIELIPYRKQPLHIEGTVDLSQRSRVMINKLLFVAGERNLALSGSFGNGTVNMLIKGTSVDGSVLSELANAPVMIEGGADFKCAVKGSVDQPDMEGYFQVKNGTISEVPFDELSARFYVQHDVMTIQKAQLIKANQYALTTTGLFPFSLTDAGRKRARKQQMNLTVSLENGDMRVLPALISDIRSAEGVVSSQLRITGTALRPVFDGFVHIAQGAIDERRYFGRLKDISVDISLKNSMLTVNNFRVRSGNGIMRMQGTVALAGLSPEKYNLSWYTEGPRGVSLVIPELPIPSPLIKNDEWRLFSNLSHGEPVFAVTLSGPAERPLFSGWVELENARFTYPSVLKRSGENPANAFLSKLIIDLQLRSGKNTWYDNELASVNIQGGIRLSGPFLSPDVTGTIEAMRGTISYFGTEFEIKHAALELVKRNAFIEGEATTEVYGKTSAETDVISMIVDKSDLQHIKPRFVSQLDSTLSPEKALAKATGISPEATTGMDQEYAMRQQLIRLVDSTLTTPLARSLLRKSGIADSFKVQYLNQQPIKPLKAGSPTMAELLYGTKYSVGKNLTNQLQLGYSVIFDELNKKLDLRHELEMSYKLQRNTFLKGVYELNTHNPLRQYDQRITLEQQWRFNLFGSGSKKKTKRAPSSPGNKPVSVSTP